MILFESFTILPSPCSLVAIVRAESPFLPLLSVYVRTYAWTRKRERERGRGERE